MEPDTPDDELRRYVRRNVIYAILLLLGLLVGVGLVGLFYEEELLLATRWTYHTIGTPGLALIVFAADAFTSPIPPDLALIVVAKSELAKSWWVVVPLLGAVSVIGGNVGWLVGLKLGETRLARLLFGRFRDKQGALVARYGVVGVALGAMTPIPFSVTCWAAGMFHMPWRRFAVVSLLRLPRFLVYYAAIAFSDDLFTTLF